MQPLLGLSWSYSEKRSECPCATFGSNSSVIGNKKLCMMYLSCIKIPSW